MVPAARRRRPNEKKLRADLFRLRAERHANADLARALRDRVTQHAVGSDRRQEQRDAGENSGEQRGRATRDQAVRDARVHRADVIDRQVGIGRAHQFAQRLGERFRALARARDDENTGVVAISVTAGKPRPAPAASVSAACFTAPTTPTIVNSFASSVSSPSAIL